MNATLVTPNCQPVWIHGSAMIFNSKQANGHWAACSGNTQAKHAVVLMHSPGHVGASDVTPDGRWVLLEVDQGKPPGQADAAPGLGVSNDLYLLDRQSGETTRLTTGRKGTIWGRLKHDGSKVCWSEMVKTPLGSGNIFNYGLGIWELHVADIVKSPLRGGQPALANEKTYSNIADPGFYETYGWFNGKIMFASDAGVQPKSPYGNWLTSQCWLIDEGLTAPKRISRPMDNGLGGTAFMYHEFMTVASKATFDDGPWILTSIVEQSNGGMDLWRMKPDGSQPTRITWFNGKPGGGQVQGFPVPQYTVVGGLAIDPRHPKMIYAGLSHSPLSTTLDMWKITT